MWVITRIGFFNIIEQDDDREKGLLTVKARCRGDLEGFSSYIRWQDPSLAIEGSLITDYRYRIKATRGAVVKAVSSLVDDIDYGKTKPAIMKDFPERSGIYYQVWENLYEIQRLSDAAKTKG